MTHTPIWKQTFTGTMFDLADPKPENIYLDDIVNPLACINRYDGHAYTGTFGEGFSVLKHSLLVADLVGWRAKPYALLHDAHEAYIGDIGTPVAYLLIERADMMLHKFSAVKRSFDLAIWKAFGLKVPSRAIEREIAEADLLALHIERAEFLEPSDDKYWPKAPCDIAGWMVSLLYAHTDADIDSLRNALVKHCPKLPPDWPPSEDE